MRFSAIHKVTSYLMVAAAFATLALSRELSPLTIGFTLLFGAVSFFFEPARVPLLRARSWTATWNALTLAVFAWTLLEAIRGELLGAGVRFLCFLLVNKLWNRKSSRDYLQAYVVSFLMLVAGAALNSELAYAGCFLAYVVFATWTLTLFHLRREMEENYLIKHSDDGAERVEVERILNSRRIVGWSFLGATSLVSIGVFLSAAITFFLIPRFGFGFFATHQRHGSLTVGFSDRVDLDAYGRIKDNPQVILRIEFPGAQPTGPLHLRGVVFDKYERGRWSRTVEESARELRNWGGYGIYVRHGERLTGPKVRALLDHAVEQRVYLDPLDTSVIFGASMPVAYAMPGSSSGLIGPYALVLHGADEPYAMEHRIRGYTHDDLTERKSGLRYSVWSDIDGPAPETLAAADDVDIDEELAPYIVVPADLPPRIRDLAQQITAHKRGPWQKALAIRDYLQRYKYTLDLKRDARYEPLEDFLFVQKQGHCEYFASALAIMLRTVGVPTRSVNGFYGGEWNSFGHYLAVRQGDAHSWVEVYVDGAGWVTVDPTPPGAAVATTGAWNTVRQMLDNIELAWFKYVIEYDLGKQVELARSVGRWAQLGTKRDALERFAKKHAQQTLGVAFALVGLFFALRAWRRRRAPSLRVRRGAEALHAYARALKALERRGFARGAGETGRELAARVAAAGDPAAAPFAELVERYYAARFGAADVPSGELERLAQAVAAAPPAPPTPTARAA